MPLPGESNNNTLILNQGTIYPAFRGKRMCRARLERGESHLFKTTTRSVGAMTIHRSMGSFRSRSLSRIVLLFSLALTLTGCGSNGSAVCNGVGDSACPVSKPGPEILYGFAQTDLLNLSVMTTIDSSTGGFGSVSSGPTPFFANGAAVVSNAQFLYISNSFIDGLPNNGSQIFGYSISPVDGTLTPIAGSPFFLFPPPSSIQGLAITPNGQFLYGADFAGFIYAFNIESGTGVPTLIPGSPFASGPNSQLVVDPAGKFLYASNDNDPVDSILAFTIEPSGALTPVPNSPFAIPGSTGGTSEPYGIVDTGSFVYTTLITNQVAAFAVNSETGALTPVPGSPFPAGSAPSFLALANNFLYAQNADGSISGYSIDSSSGVLTPIPDSPFVGLNAETLATDPSGRHLYLGKFDGIQGYNIDSTTGALTLGSANFGEAGVLWLTTVQLPSSADK
jgi:6-phosphogluconolactonase (cycloisomerase 2 family)